MEKEEFQIKLKIPEFVKILDETVRTEVLNKKGGNIIGENKTLPKMWKGDRCSCKIL